MNLQTCAHCGVRVVVTAEGACPSCRRSFYTQEAHEEVLSATLSSRPAEAGSYCRNCGKPVQPHWARCRCHAPPWEGRNFCDGCANPTYQEESKCVNCDRALASGRPSFTHTLVASHPPKDPSLIAALSVIPFPWLGQIILGQTAKGVTMLIATCLLSGICVGLGLFVLSAIDAYYLAKALKEGGSIGPWEFFWSVHRRQRRALAPNP